MNALCSFYIMLKNLSRLLLYHLYHNATYEILLLPFVAMVQSSIVSGWYSSDSHFHRPLLHNWVNCITSKVWLAWMRAKHSGHDSMILLTAYICWFQDTSFKIYEETLHHLMFFLFIFWRNYIDIIKNH